MGDDQLSHRIADKRVLKLVKGWLRAGVMDENTQYKTWLGTPQGAVISPLLANIYLHYVLDLWVQQWRKRHARGEVYIVRYADDFVMGFQYKKDAEQFKLSLQIRLADFKLSLNESKTQLIEFGRFAKRNRQNRTEGKPKTFDFLGFTHICSVRWGSEQFALLRVSIKKKLRAKIREIKETLRRNINRSPYETGKWLNKVLTGYFNYFAVPRNGKSLGVMRTEVCKLWLKTLRRRSQKGRKLNWQAMNKLVRFFIPHTRIRHPYPNQRFHL